MKTIIQTQEKFLKYKYKLSFPKEILLTESNWSNDGSNIRMKPWINVDWTLIIVNENNSIKNGN